jgi:hypothetical protein
MHPTATYRSFLEVHTMRLIRSKIICVSGIVCLFVALSVAFAQSTSGGSQANASPTALFTNIPLVLRPIATALGNRLQSPGNERATVVGTFTAAGKSYPGTLTYELPNKVRLDEGGSQPQTIAFDGTVAWASYGSIQSSDQNLLESLLDDAPESFLYCISHGSGSRLLVARGRMDNGSTPNYTGPWVAVYQLVGPDLSQQTTRQKHFYFDWATRLPLLVRYQIKAPNGSVVSVETARSNWITTNGQTAPGTITRSENGSIVFTLQAASASFSASATDGFFSQN